MDLRPLALSPVPDGSEGGAGVEDEDEVGVDGSSGGGSGRTSRSSNGEEGGEAGAAVGLGNEDSCASIVGLPGVVMEEGLGAAASAVVTLVEIKYTRDTDPRWIMRDPLTQQRELHKVIRQTSKCAQLSNGDPA